MGRQSERQYPQHLAVLGLCVWQVEQDSSFAEHQSSPWNTSACGFYARLHPATSLNLHLQTLRTPSFGTRRQSDCPMGCNTNVATCGCAVAAESPDISEVSDCCKRPACWQHLAISVMVCLSALLYVTRLCTTRPMQNA